MRLIAQALRMTRRDWRAGELRLLGAALVIAVAAVTSVGFFVDRLRAGLDRDAAQLLGGDVVATGDDPLPAEWHDEAVRRGLAIAETQTFPSMAIRPPADGEPGEPRSLLAALKAVSTGYPLRGTLRVAARPNEPDQPTRDVPPTGTVWVDEQLVAALGARVGDALRLGDRTFRVDRVLTFEPDRGAGFVNFAPRVLLRADELASTGLVQPGSRITYRLLVAGDAHAVRDFRAWLAGRTSRGQRIDALDGGRPEMSDTVDRAKSFLSLVSLLAALLAAVAVALAARRFSQRHVDSCAVMRCIGLTQPQVTALFGIEFLIVGWAASLIGLAAGWAGHRVLLDWLGSLVKTDLPPPSAMPAVQGVVTGMLLLLGFAVPPLLQLRRVAPLQVLRREFGLPSASVVATSALGVAAFFALLLWAAGDLRLGAIAGGGFVLGFAVFGGVAWAMVRGIRVWRTRLSGGSVVLRFAMAGATRRPASTVVQVVSLGVGLMALLLLSITRTDLVDGWRAAAPADAPNRFVLNIQPEQRDPFNAALVEAGLPKQDLLPMVRGRLVRVNGTPVGVDSFEGRAKRLVDREFNLSYMRDRPPYNAIVAGSWFAPDAHEISVEQGLMKDLGLKLGDVLVFDVAGQQVEARISSVRKVEWNSFKVNFFVIFPPALLEPMQQSFITSFHMPPSADAGPRLVARFPNLTIVDTGAILRQVQAVLDQVTKAVEFLFVFTLAAGMLVLAAALTSTRDERLREAGLLRALGASRRQLARAQALEFAFVGGLAGVLAALAAIGISWALARWAFRFDMTPQPAWIAYGAAAGACIALVGGWLGLRRVLSQPPLATLREAA